MADLIFTAAFVVGVIVAASATHRLLCRPYEKALKRVVDAANDPYNSDLAQALDAADELLGRRP